MKKLTIISMMLIAAALMTACGMGSAEDAKFTAGYLPEGAQFVRTEKDDGFTEHIYRDENGEYKLLTDSSDSVRALEYDAKARSTAETISLSADEAFAKITADRPEAQLLAAVEDRDDGRYEYGILFADGSDLGYYELDAATGDILDFEIFYGLAASVDLTGILESNMANPAVTEISLDADDGRLYLEGEARTDNGLIEFTIDADSGILVEAEYDD